MRRLRTRWLLCLVCSGLVVLGLTRPMALAQKGEDQPPDLSEFRTAETAVTTKVSLAGPSLSAKIPGYLGLHVTASAKGKVVVTDVEKGSPAAQAGLQKGDVVEKAGAN